MFGKANGVVFVFLMFITSLLGAIFILFPFIPLAYLAPRAWRSCADRFVGYWLTFPASLVELVFGTSFHITGDLVERNKPALIIMNHRTRLDWLFLWNALYKMDPWLLTSEKISLKAPLKKIPGAGWAMGCGAFVFLERNFEKDQATLSQMLQYYKDFGRKYQMLLFPEGTDRGARAIAISDAFADKEGLPRYEYLLHPRTTGFNYMLDVMQNNKYITYVYDVTVGYPDHVIESEMQLFKTGVFPKNVHFDFKKYDMTELPKGQEERSKWLTDLWKKKEERLRRFYTSDKKFVASGERLAWPVECVGIGYRIAFLFWVLTSFMWIYFTIAYMFVKIYILAAICFYVYAQQYHNGVEFLLLKWATARSKSIS